MKFALLTAMLAMNFLIYPMLVEAASDDDELSIMAAEQRKDDDANVTVREDVEIFDSKSNTEGSGESIENSGNSVVTENVVNEENTNINEAETVVHTNTNVTENVKKNETLQENVNTPNPIVAYPNFEDAAKKVGFVPLYIPKKSGFAMNYIAVIGGNMVEIRYSKRWEPTVTLSVRTYKRSAGEELKDISGVQGVKWKVDLSSGMTIYIARVNNNTNAAAWSVGQYTFAAMTENLSFAAFHSFIVEELVDLCNHYFISI